VSSQKILVISHKVGYQASAFFPTLYKFVILKLSDIEDDMDPILAMHTHGAMLDDGNDALCAVANEEVQWLHIAYEA
jgi:hypothetical protein